MTGSVSSKYYHSFIVFVLVLNINLANAINVTIKIFGCCLEEKVLRKLDTLRGDIPRAKFLSRLIEKIEE
jgi:hypothetical protein